MKQLSAGYIAKLKNPVQRRVKLFTVTLVDGQQLFLSSSSEPMEYGGNVFIASPGVTLSAIRNSINADTQTATAELIYDPRAVTAELVRRGGLDGATFKAVQVHSDDTGAGEMLLFSGYIDDVDFADLKCEVNLTGYSSRQGAGLIGEAYSERCRNVFGDSRCKYPVDTVSQEFTVGAQGTSAQAFYAYGLTPVEPGFWDFGTVKFTEGLNKGRVYDMTVQGEQVVITNPVAYPISVGDVGILRPGCSKFRAECVGKWDNLINMNAEPDVPNLTAGVDSSPQDQPVKEQYVTDSDGNLVYFRPGGITPAKYDPGVWPETNRIDTPMYGS